MRILIISDLALPYIGGGEIYVSQLGMNLTRLGHEVHWLTSKIPNTKEYENYHGIHIHRIPILFSRKFLFPGRQTFPFMAVLKKLDFLKKMDIVQANTLVAGYSGWRIARKINKPSLLFCYEFFGELWKRVGQNFIEKKIYPEMEKRIARSPYHWYACPSEYSKKTLIKAGAPADKVTIIPLGINHELFNVTVDKSEFGKKFNLQENKIFGFAGRLRIRRTGQSKNLVALLQATKKVARFMPSAKLVLKGDGYEEIAPFVEKLGISKNVVYVGNFPHEDNPKFLRMCDVVVCPALSDGFCFLLAEAAACGVPTVATNSGSHSERVIDGKTGLLSKPEPESIAECILEILRDENMARRLGQEAEIYAKNFTWERTAQKHLELYSRLIENKQHKII